MTDLEFAKEVAEKVWGLESHYHQIINKYYFNIDSHIFYDDDISKEVNSWAGFGRTVEAMEKKSDYNAKHILALVVDAWLYDYTGHEGFIKATHQAALDAVKEK